MRGRRFVELGLISLLAAFCGGLAWALDHELFAWAFAAAAVTGAFGAGATLVGTGGSGRASHRYVVAGPGRQTLPCVRCGPSRYRSLSLNPRRARPPATTRAIQLTHIGIDQSPIMTVHSMKIRAR